MSHLVVPDMVLNVYSFYEYWLAMACDHQKKEKGLSLSHGDIRGNNDIHAFQKGHDANLVETLLLNGLGFCVFLSVLFDVF